MKTQHAALGKTVRESVFLPPTAVPECTEAVVQSKQSDVWWDQPCSTLLDDRAVLVVALLHADIRCSSRVGRA